MDQLNGLSKMGKDIVGRMGFEPGFFVLDGREYVHYKRYKTSKDTKEDAKGLRDQGMKTKGVILIGASKGGGYALYAAKGNARR